MKKTNDEMPPSKTILSIRSQAMNKEIELKESSAKVCELAEHIAKRNGISMVDYSNYNNEVSRNKFLTDDYLGFTLKYRSSLR